MWWMPRDIRGDRDLVIRGSMRDGQDEHVTLYTTYYDDRAQGSGGLWFSRWDARLPWARTTRDTRGVLSRQAL
jgi:hypothetical protein